MTEQELQLISGLFEQLRRMNGQPKDAQADAAIRQQAPQTADALYWLTQRTLLLEQSLQQAQQQITQLQNQAPPSASGGSFLSSGLDTHFGRAPQSPAPDYNQPTTAYTGVPAGAPASQTTEPSSWRDRWFGGARAAAPAMPAAQPMAASAGGSFLGQAAASAAGMAGGMLLFNGLSHMLGSQNHAATDSNPANAADNNNLASNNSGIDRLAQESGRDHIGQSPAADPLMDDQANNDYSDDASFFDDDSFA